MTQDFTWWEVLLIYIFAIIAFLGVGIALGLIAAVAIIAILKRNGVILGRLHRFVAYVAAATLGAAFNYIVATSIW